MSSLKPKFIRGAGKVLLLGFSIIVCLIIVEIGLRMLTTISPRCGYFKPVPQAQAITPRTSVFNANYSGELISRDFKITLHTNSLGFRERELDFKKLSVQQPCLVVGDSTFFGWGVESRERFSERLEVRLNRRNLPVPVVNLSFPGFGTDQCLDVLAHYGPQLNPRLILFGFFVGNDFLDNFNARLQGEKPAAESSLSRSLAVRQKLRAVLHDSRLVNLFKYSLWNFPWFRHCFNALEIKNDRFILYEKNSSPRQQALYEATDAALASLAEMSQKNHWRILVVIIPDHLQILEKSIFSEGDYDRPQRILKARLDSLHLPSLDLLPFFAKPGCQDMFFKEDKHWNAEGNDFAAEIIFQYLLSSGDLRAKP